MTMWKMNQNEQTGDTDTPKEPTRAIRVKARNEFQN